MPSVPKPPSPSAAPPPAPSPTPASPAPTPAGAPGGPPPAVTMPCGAASSSSSAGAAPASAASSAGSAGAPGAAASSSSRLPDSAIVVRGGACKADSFTNGSGVVTRPDGTLTEVSVNSTATGSLKDLASGPHKSCGHTTVGAIRAAGGDVVPSPTRGNPTHATLSGLTAQQAEALFTVTQKKNL